MMPRARRRLAWQQQVGLAAHALGKRSTQPWG
jgi:hypothetical protein